MLLHHGAHHVAFTGKSFSKLSFHIITADLTTCNILKNLTNRGSLDTGLAGFSSSGGGAGGASS